MAIPGKMAKYSVAILLPPLLALGSTADELPVRDPFWPVGYAPAPEKPTQEIAVKTPPKPQPVKRVVEPPKPVVDWKAARGALKVSGYAEAKGIRRCFVNGKLVSEGETVTLAHTGLRYAWRVVRIAPLPSDSRFEEVNVRPVGDGPSNVRP